MSHLIRIYTVCPINFEFNGIVWVKYFFLNFAVVNSVSYSLGLRIQRGQKDALQKLLTFFLEKWQCFYV